MKRRKSRGSKGQRTALLRSLREKNEQLEVAYDITLQPLRDSETEGHSKRVTFYNIALVQADGVSGDALRVIARGAFLHDIGTHHTGCDPAKPGSFETQEIAHCSAKHVDPAMVDLFLRQPAPLWQDLWHEIMQNSPSGILSAAN